MKNTATHNDYIWLGEEPPQREPSVLSFVWSVVRLVLITAFIVGVPLLVFTISVAIGYWWLQWYVHR